MTEEILELLEDIQDGDYVCVRWGNPQVETEGVIKIDSYSLRIQNNDGEPTRIRLNELSGITKKAQPENSGEESISPTVPIEQSPADPEPLLSETPGNDSGEKKEFVPIPPYHPYSFSVADQITSFKASMKAACSREFCNKSNGILDGMGDAIKTGNQILKYRALRQRAIRLWTESCECDADYEHFYKLLGILSVSADAWSEALEPFVRAKCYLPASYAASKLGDQNREEIFYLCALLNKEAGTTLDQRLVDICIRRKDITPFEYLSKQCKDYSVLDSCIAAVCTSENCLPDAARDLSGSAFVNACIQSLPVSWRKCDDFRSRWVEFGNYSYPDSASPHDDSGSETEYIDSIRKFDAFRGAWGFIGETYFHISQVCDSKDTDILLRKLLLGNRGVGLNVRYHLGKSQQPGHIGEAIATDIILDEASFEEAQRRLKGPAKAGRTGCITYYDPEKGNGTLLSQGKRYYFDSQDVRDPYLKAYCTGCFDFKEQDVTFTPSIGKGFPKDICWLQPQEELLESYAESVTPEQKYAWLKFKADQSMKLPDDQECLKIKFSPLDPLDPDTPHVTAPLTWPESKHVQKALQRGAANVAPPKPAAAMPQAGDVQTGRKSTLPRAPLSGQNQHRTISRPAADQAMGEGRLDDAEEILNELLQQCNDDDIPQIINKLVTIYLQQSGKMDHAKKLVKQYEDKLPQDKQVNLKIRILEKTKDDDAELCQLYEESIRLSPAVAQKAHRLLFMGNVYMRMGDYSQALQSFQRWEKLYAQSRYTQDAKKMQGNVQSINRQKAICLYRTEQVNEAKEIALDLVRLNPSDTVATAILDDTPDVINNSDYEILFNDDFADIDSKLPIWIRKQIDSLDLSEATSAKNVKDGRYVGSLSEAKKDIERQINRSKENTSPSARYKALLTAYKIQEQTKQDAFTTLCGRAIASWGHYMVTQPRQMDTPRMAYLYALQLLRDSDQEWTDSYNAYLKSYFMDRSAFEDYILGQLRSNKHEPQNTDVFTTHQIRDELFSEFFVGILCFVRNLKGKQFDTVAKGLYRANDKLRDAVCTRFERLLNRNFSGDEQNFKDMLRAACTELDKQLDRLHRQLQRNMEKILEAKFKDELISIDKLELVLTKTDRDRVEAIREILLGMQNYVSSRDFENQAECLRTGISKSAELVASIQEEPTDFSYEKILTLVGDMKFRLMEAQDSLYRDYAPCIALNENGTPHRAEDGVVLVYLRVSNEDRRQTADEIEITIKREADGIRLHDPVKAFSLRGGKEQDIVLTLDVGEDALRNGTFQSTVMCRYAYNSEPDKRDEDVHEQALTFVISNEEFTRLHNPFLKYIATEMDNKEMFFGRDAMIQLLADKICDPDGHMCYGRAVAVYGQTRCGKTSLIIHLKKHLEARFPERLLMWDMQNIGDVIQGDMQMGDFLYEMLCVGESAIQDHPILGPIVQSQNIHAPLDEVLHGEHALPMFNGYMSKINRILEKNDCIIVLFIDEFSYLHDFIKQERLPPEFMKFWKAFLQNNKVFALVAGQDDMPEFIDENQNEFATMDLLMMTYLDEIPAKKLFAEPLRTYNTERVIIDPLCADKVFSLTAGSAYLIIILCSALVDYLNEKHTSTISPGIFDDFLKKKVFCDRNSCLIENYFEPQLEERGHKEYNEENRKILYAIAELSCESGLANVATIAERIGMEEARVKELTERLVNRQVIDRNLDQGQPCFKIRVQLFEQWLRLKGE